MAGLIEFISFVEDDVLADGGQKSARWGSIDLQHGREVTKMPRKFYRVNFERVN